MECANGHPNPAGQRFCGECGAELPAAFDNDAADDEPSMRTGTSWKQRLRRPIVLIPALLLVIGAVVAIVVLSSGGGDTKHTIVGSLTLTDRDEYWSKGDACEGSGGYDDIRSGAQVVVKDGAGKVLGTSSLDSGTASGRFDCDFVFLVTDLPDADFYAVEVSHRGEISHSRKELEDNAWIVGLSLGS